MSGAAVGFIGLAVAVGALVVAAIASFSAAKAHRETAQICREMSDTWAAIATAQRHMKRDRMREADRGLEVAAQTILSSRRERQSA